MIIVENLTKVFHIPHMKSDTVYHSLLSVVLNKYTYEKFSALNNVSFRIPEGQFVGVIGRNGSGKSTLLKILSNVYQPTSGTVTVNEEIFPLLELSVGFQRDFSVRENIYLYGALLGFTRKEMGKKMDDILAFTELEQFVDARLDKLSSGMQTKLGFAIAIQSVAPIILVDEVLAVGDNVFKEKCKNIFRKFKSEGKTIMLVSHDLGAVKEFCDRVLLVHQGNLIGDGKPEEIIALYNQKILSAGDGHNAEA